MGRRKIEKNNNNNNKNNKKTTRTIKLNKYSSKCLKDS